MNLFRSEEHVRRFWGYDAVAAVGTMPLLDWAYVFSVEFCRAKLEPDFFLRGLRLREGLFRALRELGKSGSFWGIPAEPTRPEAHPLARLLPRVPREADVMDEKGVDQPVSRGSKAESARSPVTLEDLELLKKTVFFTDEDATYLRLAGDVVSDQLPEIIDAWFSAHPYLYAYFRGPDGELIWRYVEAVRRRSAEWILESCRRPYDQAWLDYAHEVGLRHHRTKKNATDEVAAPPVIPLRYMIAFSYHTIEMLRPFLARKGHAATDVERMHEAWRKSVLLQVALWSHAYAKEGDW